MRTQRPPVLIVEDDDAVRRALAMLLRSTGFDVIEAATVAEAKARADAPALAILDLNLPDGLGLDVIDHLRAHHPLTRIAIVSATSCAELLDEVERRNPDAVFAKPIDVTQLVDWLCAQAA